MFLPCSTSDSGVSHDDPCASDSWEVSENTSIVDSDGVAFESPPPTLILGQYPDSDSGTEFGSGY